jgi:predicted dehydrogenase
MKTTRVGIIMNGVTGRMGANQHLERSIAAIIKQGGVRVADDHVIMPDPMLIGRNENKLRAVAEKSGVNPKFSTDLAAALADPAYSVYFDAQSTDRRVESVTRAIAVGKHIYCEKPTAADTASALRLHQLAKAAGVKHGVVQDKLWLPGIIKLRQLIATGFFGEIFSVRGEFGYWVFEGDTVPAQRPSWNYRAADAGGIIIDMLCHWRYLLDHVFGPVKAVSCLGATHVKQRWDESGRPYTADADDSAYATFELENGIIAQFNSSWCVRVRRDDLLTLQVDGSRGSAVAGLRNCVSQQYNNTPRPVWNPDIEQPINFYQGWSEVPTQRPLDNAFKMQWELFLRHVVLDEPFPWNLREAAKGVQLAEAGVQSWKQRRWVSLEPLAD